MIRTGKYYESIAAKCCYYHGEASHKIICEGIYPRSTVHLAFGSYDDWKLHKEKFCNTYDFAECPVARMLDEVGIDVDIEPRSDEIDLGEEVGEGEYDE